MQFERHYCLYFSQIRHTDLTELLLSIAMCICLPLSIKFSVMFKSLSRFYYIYYVKRLLEKLRRLAEHAIYSFTLLKHNLEMFTLLIFYYYYQMIIIIKNL